jgi:hypothetical protein
MIHLIENKKVQLSVLFLVCVLVMVGSDFRNWLLLIGGLFALFFLLRKLFKNTSELKWFFSSIWFVYIYGFLLLCVGGGDPEMTSENLQGVIFFTIYFFPVSFILFILLPYYQVKVLLGYEGTFVRTGLYVWFGWTFFFMIYHVLLFNI